MNTAKRDKIILSVLAIIIIGVIMYYVAISPCIKEIKDLNAKIDNATSTIEGYESKRQQLAALEDEIVKLEEEVKANEGTMPDFDDYALYLADFQDITENRATDTSILFNGMVASESGNYTVVQASIKFVCTYDDLKVIMDKMLEKNVHCYDVKIVDQETGDTAEDGTTMLKVEFVADYYSRSGAYTPTEYDFTSGRYGLTELFNGVAIDNVVVIG